jgi:hypothetical protein
MSRLLGDLAYGILVRVADAVETGRLAPPFSEFSVSRHVTDYAQTGTIHHTMPVVRSRQESLGTTLSNLQRSIQFGCLQGLRK